MDMVHGSVFLAICSNWIGVALLATDTNVVPCRGGGGGGGGQRHVASCQVIQLIMGSYSFGDCYSKYLQV